MLKTSNLLVISRIEYFVPTMSSVGSREVIPAKDLGPPNTKKILKTTLKYDFFNDISFAKFNDVFKKKNLNSKPIALVASTLILIVILCYFVGNQER